MFYCENWGSFGLKSMFYHRKGGSFWIEKSVFYHEKGVVLSSKVLVMIMQCFAAKKGGNFQTREQGWVPLFPVSEGAGILPV